LRYLSFDPRHLDIELTESVIMRDTARAGAVLEALKALGLQLSIDDFGTGYSSLSYLRRFPFDSLKIDRSFVCDTPGAAEATAIVRAIVAMGRSLGMRIIAEGVETAEQVGFLTSVGCDLLQGWGMVPALPQEEFLKLLQARRRIEPPQPAPACASDAGYAPA
jgi:EAL domain-containing protein (putative c-di-GMP-specific phosphodiesterase class I)